MPRMSRRKNAWPGVWYTRADWEEFIPVELVDGPPAQEKLTEGEKVALGMPLDKVLRQQGFNL